jgi:alkanesulfonate monooxygenase SsuD/methylene tetrahydromethanopterin reductase-like flavin-dependent oxidoreductase (luciferase family)
MAACGTFLIEALGSTLAQIRETVQVTEEAGFGGLFLGENHFPRRACRQSCVVHGGSPRRR